MNTNSSDRKSEKRLAGDIFRAAEISDQFNFWFPAKLPQGTSVCISSSRLGQKLDHHKSWFDALRTIAVQLQRENKFLISASDTTTDPFVHRIAKLFAIPIVQFKPLPSALSTDWLETTAENRRPVAESCDACTPRTVWFRQSNESDTKININDLIVSIAREVILLSVRRSGNIFAAATQRLESQTESIGESNSNAVKVTGSSIEPLKENNCSTTRLLINRKLTPKPVESKLLDGGASGWWLYSSEFESESALSPSPGVIESPSANESKLQLESKLELAKPQIPEPVILERDEVDAGQFLLHWTRRRVGPWPDQTHASYLDDLIFQSSRRKHSEMSALCRILASRTILGSNDLTRDSRRVVCLSDLPIDELKDHRVFRPHLSRWDFEPYGLAIDRSLLKNLGAKPAIYGDDSTWASLSQDQRPFFQPETSASEKIDWKTEREWRIIGDLRLELIPRDRAFVFVASTDEAKIIASLCHWPVVVLGD